MRCVVRLLGVCFCCAFVLTAGAQEGLRVGQDVKVNVRGNWVNGSILRMMPDGASAQVRALVNGRYQTGIVPLEQLRPRGENKTAPGNGAQAPAARTWSDNTGQFRIEAVYVGRAGDFVTLRKTDGSEISVPLAKLSQADRDYVATLANQPGGGDKLEAKLAVGSAAEVKWGQSWYAAKVLKIDGQRYFIHYEGQPDVWDEWVGPDRIRISETKVASAAPANSPAAASAGSPAAPTGETVAVKPLNIGAVTCRLDKTPAESVDETAAPPQNASPDPEADGEMPAGAVTLVALETFNQWQGFVPADVERGLLLAAMTHQPPSNPSTRFYWCDVPDGKITQEVRFQGAHRPLAGSGAAGWLLTNGPRDEENVVVWRWPQGDQAPEPAYRLSLATDYNSAFAKNISRAWVHNGRAILQTEGKRVVVWNLESKQLEKSWEGYKAAVSPGGRYLAFTTDKGIALIDLTSGKQLGFWSLGYLSVANLEFSPQGTSLAVLLQSDLKVLDLTTGKLRFDNALPQGAGSTTLGPPRWCSENMVMIGRQYLVDLERGFVVWQYVTRGGVFGVPVLERIGGKLCYLSEHFGRTPASIVSLDLPHAAVTEAVNGINPAEVFALAPGGSVGLQVNAGAEAAAIRQALEQRITQNGWKLAPDSPIRMVVTVRQGEAKTETYREGLGGTGAASTVTFRPTVSEVDVQVNGVSAWRTATETFLPAVLFSSGGKSTQEAVRDYEKPSLEFFAQLPLPRQIVKPEYQAGLGKSGLSAEGVSDGEATAPKPKLPPRPPSRRPSRRP